MKKFNLGFGILVITASLFFTACSKSSSTSPGGGTGTGTSLAVVGAADAQADDVYNNVYDNVAGVNSNQGLGTGIGVTQLVAPSHTIVYNNEQLSGGEHLSGGADTIQVNSCATITIDTSVSSNGYPATVTIDFGTGCLGKDGILRRGQIITVFSGPLSVAGSVATTTFNGYYVDTILVGGTHTITNVSSGGTNIYSVQVTNGMLTEPSGNYIIYNKTKTLTQTAGATTPTLWDDSYSITGSSSGTTSYNGNTYQWTGAIVTGAPLIYNLDCRWIVQGQKQYTWNNTTATIDFGSGTCDANATLTVDGVSYPFLMW